MTIERRKINFATKFHRLDDVTGSLTTSRYP